jgi:large subunit ribosomal protein L32
MAVPKKKVSKSKRNMRRSHDALDALNLVPCPNCKAPRLSHSVCESCGFYNGRFVDKRFLKNDLMAILR